MKKLNNSTNFCPFFYLMMITAGLAARQIKDFCKIYEYLLTTWNCAICHAESWSSLKPYKG